MEAGEGVYSDIILQGKVKNTPPGGNLGHKQGEILILLAK